MIIHYAFLKDGTWRYLCNQACGTIDEKRTNDYFKVTCKNCKRELDKDKEKLETSKDLISDLISEVKESELKKGVPARIIWPENLKQAAIKRIKYLEKINKEESKFARHEFIKGRIHELKEFCNITEEDLK